MPKKVFKKNFSKINNHIFCYDCETGGIDPYTCDLLEFTGMTIDIDTRKIKEDGTFGPVLVKPWDNDYSRISEDALKKNGLSIQEIKEKGLDQKVFFDQLTAFMLKFRRSEKIWDALIPSGFNIHNFDNILMRIIAKRYNYDDKLFHPFHSFDLADFVRPFFYNTNTLESFSLENIRKYFGLTNVGAHTSEYDVRSTAMILCRFLDFYVNLSPKYLPKFANCFSEGNNEETHN